MKNSMLRMMWFSAVHANLEKLELLFPFMPHTLFTIL